MTDMKHYQIKVNAVNQALSDQSLKKWWVAEFSGIHRTTFQRWLSGKTRFVLRQNAENLAKILELPLTEIASPIKRSKVNSIRYRSLPKLDD